MITRRLLPVILSAAGVLLLGLPGARSFETTEPSSSSEFSAATFEYAFLNQQIADALPAAWETIINIAPDYWTDVLASGFSWTEDGGSSNKLQHAVLDEQDLAEASAPCPPNDPNPSCHIYYQDFSMKPANTWYVGIGVPPQGKTDLLGVTVHEFGHWLGMTHDDECPGSGGLLSPPPTQDMNTMCYVASAQHPIVDRRTPAQDDIQGAHYMGKVRDGSHRWFAANGGMELCASGGSSCIPDYWIVVHATTSWSSASNGSLTVEPSPPFSEAELYQAGVGLDMDGNNNGRYRVELRARSADAAATVEVFVTSSAEELTCTISLTNSYSTDDCSVDFLFVPTEIDYGVRSDEEIDITRLWVRDKQS